MILTLKDQNLLDDKYNDNDEDILVNDNLIE